MTTTHDVAELPAAWVSAFNSRDEAALDELYEDQGVLVPAPGQPMVGRQRKAANARLLSSGQSMEAKPRHIYVNGDVALIIIDWAMGDMTGTATDIARRGSDGRWRYVIDNPFGTA